MSTVDEITISDEVFEAQLNSALSTLEGRTEADLADEAVANHLLEASGDRPELIRSIAGVDFTKIDDITVTLKNQVKPIAVGKTARTYKCFALSRGLVS